MSAASRFVVRSTFAFLLIGLVALLAIVGMTFWLGLRSQAYFDQSISARDTRTAAVELRNALLSAETAQRGYLLTNNEIYLAPYDTAKAQAQRRLGDLQKLLVPFPDAAASIQRLTTLVGLKFDELEQTIALKRGGHDDEALAIVNTNKGKAVSDEANVFFSGIIGQADDRLTTGVEEQTANASYLRLVSGIGALVIILVVGGAAYVLLRYTRELRIAQEQLNGLNAALESRVTARTAELSSARDRAEVLLSEVNHRVANSLALVSSLMTLQSRSLSDQAVKKALSEAQDRVFAISLVHRRLYSGGDARMVSLDEYLSGLLDHLKTSLRNEGQGATLDYTIEPVLLPTDAAVNLGVIVTEWVTNAFKYAYPDTAGPIRVRIAARPDDMLELVVEDDGVGRSIDASPKGTGLGTRIVTAMAASLGGTVSYEPRQPGTAATLIFAARPAETVAAQ